jgi:hypothetical protein
VGRQQLVSKVNNPDFHAMTDSGEEVFRAAETSSQAYEHIVKSTVLWR